MAETKEKAALDKPAIAKEFGDAVNMTATALAKWLQTSESKEVGWKGEEGDDASKESVGHQSGKKIIEILGKKKADLMDADYHHMEKVVGYVHRHRAQRPKADDVAHTRWAYSLKNWGHDPTKADPHN